MEGQGLTAEHWSGSLDDEHSKEQRMVDRVGSLEDEDDKSHWRMKATRVTG